MLADDVDYADLGGDYFARLDPERAMRRIVRQANALGFTVLVEPVHASMANSSTSMVRKRWFGQLGPAQHVDSFGQGASKSCERIADRVDR
ncbi:hypothetical protein [Mycobacterium persicum]|uniref:Uncharacterized protein n=1 Tax=Mycobacterium persicum TaxID=1487726 RepID=A0AB38UNQ5_9MYCO|nr:hypothetical protein [Mycobacterium persicum]ORB38846.1 hypothetical protein BST40_22885 [Mycobacterium persicum]ORB90897.1 hypothetical protein B1T49_18510 [Mycobacterium persicum]ORC03000.1 hypothetical protein B1T48_18840 [Mycobacterium persicum]VAZ82066.1 hypothetical protein LAUMK42_00870 [Mycobacterium persicum]